MPEDINPNFRLSVRRAMPGMISTDANTNSGITPGAGLKKLLRNASTSNGCVKVQIKNLVLTGKNVSQRDGSGWKEKFDSLNKSMKSGEACYIVLWRAQSDVLLVSYNPDDGKPKEKMLYAATRGALKDSLVAMDDKVEIEEFNVTSVEEVSIAKYDAIANIPKAYSDFEIEKMEIEQEEAEERKRRAKEMAENASKGIKNAPPVALLGLGAAAAAIAAGKKDGKLNVRSAAQAANKASKLSANTKVEKPKALEKVEKPEVATEVEEEIKDLQKVADEEADKEAAAAAEKAAAEAKEKEEAEAKEAAEKEEAAAKEAAEKEAEEKAAAEAKAAAEKEAAEAKEAAEKEAAEKAEKEAAEAKAAAEAAKPEEVKKAKKDIKNSFKYFEIAEKNKLSAKPELKKPNKKQELVLTEADLAELPDDDGTHELADLQKMVKDQEFGDLDKDKIETYLSSRAFAKLFNLSKDEFGVLPAWKQKRLKTKNKLF